MRRRLDRLRVFVALLLLTAVTVAALSLVDLPLVAATAGLVGVGAAAWLGWAQEHE